MFCRGTYISRQRHLHVLLMFTEVYRHKPMRTERKASFTNQSTTVSSRRVKAWILKSLKFGRCGMTLRLQLHEEVLDEMT